MHSVELRINNGSQVVSDLTAEVSDFCRTRGDGLLSVFVPHATAGVALMEVHSGSEPDLEATLARVLPIDDRYRHRHGSVGHGRDHVLPALVSPSVTVPVFGGVPALGTWRSSTGTPW